MWNVLCSYYVQASAKRLIRFEDREKMEELGLGGVRQARIGQLTNPETGADSVPDGMAIALACRYAV